MHFELSTYPAYKRWRIHGSLIWKTWIKKYIHGKPIKFGFNLWVIATPLGYCIQFRPYTGKDSILQEYENIVLDLGASVVANWVSKLPVTQTSSYQIVLSVMGVDATGVEALERNGSCCNRNGESKPNGKWSIARYGKNEKMRLLMCPRTSLQYVGKIIKSWLQFPPLLVNNELNRSNVIVIVKKTESEY